MSERVLAERISAVINSKLIPLSKEIDELRDELLKLKGELSVVKREAIRSVTEAVLDVKVREALGGVEETIKDELKKQEENLVGCINNLASRIDKLVEAVPRKEIELTPIIEEIGKLRTGIEEICGMLQKENGYKVVAEKIVGIDRRLEELEKRLENLEQLAPLVSSLLEAVNKIQVSLSQIGALDKYTEMMEELSEKVDFLYEKAMRASKRESEEEEEEE